MEIINNPLFFIRYNIPLPFKKGDILCDCFEREPFVLMGMYPWQRKEHITRRKYMDIDDRVFCGECNSICKRQTWSKQEKVWICKKRRHKCKIRKITEKELIEACKFFLDEEYEGKLVEYVEKIYIMEKSVLFQFYDGRVKIWQRR